VNDDEDLRQKPLPFGLTKDDIRLGASPGPEGVPNSTPPPVIMSPRDLHRHPLNLGILNRIPGLDDLIAVFQEAEIDEWSIVLWLLLPNPDLDDRVPLIELWAEPVSKDKLIHLAEEAAWRLKR
jgi:hypothetical protein